MEHLTKYRHPHAKTLKADTKEKPTRRLPSVSTATLQIDLRTHLESTTKTLILNLLPLNKPTSFQLIVDFGCAMKATAISENQERTEYPLFHRRHA